MIIYTAELLLKCRSPKIGMPDDDMSSCTRSDGTQPAHAVPCPGVSDSENAESILLGKRRSEGQGHHSHKYHFQNITHIYASTAADCSAFFLSIFLPNSLSAMTAIAASPDTFTAGPYPSRAR